jgi:hypothetical protein
MTPKEKAKYLVWDFYNIQSNEYDYGMNWEMAKQCALIAVDEIINLIELERRNMYIWKPYYLEVKQEIEML